MIPDYYFSATRTHRRWKAKQELKFYRWQKAHRRRYAKTLKLIRHHSALHEGAHVCAALSLSVPVLHATIECNETHTPHMRYANISAYPSLRAVIVCAGPMMSRRDGTTPEAYQGDVDTLEEMIVQMYPDADPGERSQRRKVIEAITSDKLDELAPQIRRVASELLKKQTLSGEELRALVEGAEVKEAAA